MATRIFPESCLGLTRQLFLSNLQRQGNLKETTTSRGTHGMKGTLIGSILFTAMAVWTIISDISVFLSREPIILPIAGYGYFAIVWTDYVTWTTAGGMIELFLAFLFLYRWRQKPIIGANQ
jgi:hypothetical protein